MKTKKEQAKIELEDLITYVFEHSAGAIYKYNPVDKTKKLSSRMEERINKFCNKFV